MTQQTKKKIMNRLLSIVTLSALFMALSSTGVLATFFRGISAPFLGSSSYTATTNYGYGYGYDDVAAAFGYGYGYAYTVASSGSSGGSGGWSSSSSSSSSTPTTPTVETPTTETETPVPTVENENNEVDGTDSTDTIRNEGNCDFPNPTVNYNDTQGNWAEAYIRDLSKRGIMNGVSTSILNPQGSFEPTRATTRIEFLKIALRSFCYEYGDLGGIEGFSDVVDGSWQARVVEKASALSVINTTNSTFRPNDAISRIEAMKMILKVGETRSANFTLSTATTTTFTDIPASWMMKYVETAKDLAIVSGTNNTFRPLDAINRGETAKVAVRSMNAQ